MRGYNDLPQINIQNSWNQPQTACYNMDGCYKCCEINTVSLTYGSLQVLP